MANIIDQHKSEIEAICRDSGIEYLGVFGSHSRKEEHGGSDLDLLVEFNKDLHLSLMGIVAIEQKLSDALNVVVDLVEKRALHERVFPYVMEDLQGIYGHLSS